MKTLLVIILSAFIVYSFPAQTKQALIKAVDLTTIVVSASVKTINRTIQESSQTVRK